MSKKKKANSKESCSSIIVCLIFARRGYQPYFSDILNLCEGCYNPLDAELKNVCRGKNFV